MNSKDKENIAKLYMEYTINYEDEFQRKVHAAISSLFLGQTPPIIFSGEDDEGIRDDLTVAGMPIKDYQIKNIVKALKNDSIETYGPKAPDVHNEGLLDKVMRMIRKEMEKLDQEASMDAPFEAPYSNPPSQYSKPQPRWNPGNDI